MSHMDDLLLLSRVEDGKVSKDDPRYLALIERERQHAADALSDILTRIRSHQFGTNKEVAEYYREDPDWVRYWKRQAQWLRQMSEAEWNRHLQATQRKRKRAARKHDSTT